MNQTVRKGEFPEAATQSPVIQKDESGTKVKHYRGFVAGVFSGITKLSGTYLHPICGYPTNIY
jgi:hypothetical protein